MTAVLADLVGWLTGTALPFWAERGFDHRAGRFHERLDLAGRPLAVPHRAMVQARQSYVFAHAAELGWFPGDGLAEQAMAALLRDFAPGGPAGSFAFAVGPDGRPACQTRDAYAHAFILLALAWLHRRTGDPAALAHADRLLAFLDAELRDPIHGGLFDALPLPGRTKRQNPLMHLLEACLALEQAAPGRGYLARADALVTLFHTRLFQPADGRLLEHFAEDWSAHPEASRAGAWEPGHQFEWVWLLAEHRRLAGGSASPAAAALFASAQAHGVAATGLIYAELGAGKAPTIAGHRLWPHAEAIRAAAARGDGALAKAMATTLLDRFVARPFPAGWLDRVDAAGAPAIDHVPGSALYHLFGAGAVAGRDLARA